MAEVFISYKTERRRAAEHMAAVLERYGYSGRRGGTGHRRFMHIRRYCKGAVA
jgi:hypothetical protein